MTAEQVGFLIRLGGAHRDVTDRGEPYPVIEWETTGDDYRILVSGYRERRDRLWVWRVEMSDHEPTETGHVPGASITERWSRDFDEITAAAADLINTADAVLNTPTARLQREAYRRFGEQRSAVISYRR